MLESKGERRTDVDVQIIDLLPEDEDAVRQAATLLFEVFKEHHPNAWPTMEAAMEEVKETFGENRISRVAVDSDGLVLGWIGGIGAERSQEYAWELHPLVVRPEWQGRGLGSVLVADLEDKVRQRGGCVIWLGADDENIPDDARRRRPLPQHPGAASQHTEPEPPPIRVLPEGGVQHCGSAA